MNVNFYWSLNTQLLCVGVHGRTSFVSSSLLHQQCPACLVRLILMVLAAILLSATSRICSKKYGTFFSSCHLAFFAISFASVQVVYPYSSTDIVVAWKKLYVILSERSDFKMIYIYIYIYISYANFIYIFIVIHRQRFFFCITTHHCG